MVHNSKLKSSYKMLAIVLSIIICVSFMPFVGGIANAAKAKEFKINSMKKAPAVKKLGVNSKIGADSPSVGKLFTISSPNSNGWVTLKGQLNPNYKFDTLYVDGYYAKYLGSNSINTSIDMKEYDVGYHTLYMTFKDINNNTVCDNNGNKVVDGKTYVPTYIYGSPGNGKGRYDVYHKKMFYNNEGNIYKYDTSCDTYIDYKTKGKKYKKWNKKYMDSLSTYTFPGLVPGKKFQTVLFYGKKFTYDGKDYFFSGKKSVVRTMKAGTKKMKVKKITVKAYNVRRHPIKYIYRHWTSWYTYRLKTKTVGYYYTYKLKAIVKLKKKPGAKGIMINKYRMKGNKKRYVKKLGNFSSYKKPRKTRYKIFITSYQDKTYGGWSPQIRKNCKVK